MYLACLLPFIDVFAVCQVLSPGTKQIYTSPSYPIVVNFLMAWSWGATPEKRDSLNPQTRANRESPTSLTQAQIMRPLSVYRFFIGECSQEIANLIPQLAIIGYELTLSQFGHPTRWSATSQLSRLILELKEWITPGSVSMQ